MLWLFACYNTIINVILGIDGVVVTVVAVFVVAVASLLNLLFVVVLLLDVVAVVDVAVVDGCGIGGGALFLLMLLPDAALFDTVDAVGANAVVVVSRWAW